MTSVRSLTHPRDGARVAAGTFAFPDAAVLVPGGTLRLRVSTSLRRFRVVLARSGATLAIAHRAPERFAGTLAPRGRADEAWAWPVAEIALPRDLPGGAYLAFVRGDDEPDDVALDARAAAALVVVRPVARARVLFNVPLFTYHAYGVGTLDPFANRTDGESLYTGAARVTLARPGGGIGGRLWDEANPDAYDAASPRQTWAHWDAKALAWLERRGVVPDLCTDADLHATPDVLADRALLVCFGHHEYWTSAMRHNVERFVAAGGNLAIFGGNALWFRTDYDAAARTIARAGAWPVDEAALLGTSYRRGGAWWTGARPRVAFVVREPAHWVFAGTGLRAGDAFGDAADGVGYECDGCDPLASPATRELAAADLGAWTPPPEMGDRFPGGRASLAITRRGGTVFVAGSVDWPRAMLADARLATITANVVDRLGASPGTRAG